MGVAMIEIVLLLSVGVYGTSSYTISSGCEDGTTEGLQDDEHPAIAACVGSWTGHVTNSSAICGRGWRLCSWRDDRLLHSISWEQAREIPGCYVIDAAQDSGICQPCTGESRLTSLASVGQGCPHQSVGQDGCIQGGQMHVSAGPDSACAFRPGLVSGVLCCRKPGVSPQILVRPQATTHVTSGVTFVLSCQAVGSPPPTVTWLKQGEPLPSNISRISAFDSGYLLISGSQPEDSGRYTCVVENMAGRDEAISDVFITNFKSGCADGTTDGLYGHEDIQACNGAWRGHVKRAKELCARGWRVCSPRHSNLLKLLTWADVSQLPGCYAYNAANTLSRCTRCHRSDMAGVGAGCGKMRRTALSCLAQGRIDVFQHMNTPGCEYYPGVTTGVVCCKRHDRENNLWTKRPQCSPRCINGGACVGNGRCECATGYKGAWCQNPICVDGCFTNAVCVKPGVCQCKKGYAGKKCTRRQSKCRNSCFNGGRCKQGLCKCPTTHTGSYCQTAVNWRGEADLNRTER